MRIYPPVTFSTKFGTFLRIASARAKNAYFRSFEGFQGRWGYRGHMLRNVRAKPRETAATGGIPASQRTVPQRERLAWPDVRRRPRQTAARVELWARKRTAPQGERQHNGDLRPRQVVRSGILRASEGPKNALRTAGKPTPSQKWSETCPQKELSIFRFDSKTFRKLEATSCPRKTPRPKRNNRRNEAFRDFGPRPENGQPRETAEREELIRSPNSQKNGFLFRCVRWTRPKKVPKRNFSATFRTCKKSDETPIFVAFRKFLKFPGSVSALRGLLISPLGVRNGAPYQPTRIYIYIYTVELLSGPRLGVFNSY